ncbi:hypothetical protein KG112_05395 [Nocardioides sp. zg-ZUI104]|uniref:hypothetical protein n=1 Tax=Nocardioides faecalis TaxID=2803858 RepID=UPI001BD13982|nr:hypothetical protein [Nocardioides faecalis]MBS4752242.1 hypothetical protein [Nocardioides faecalis]
MTGSPAPNFLGLLLLPVLALTACSGSDEAASPGGDGAQSQSSPNPSETSDPTAPASPSPADIALAEAALLTLSDFPAGWESVPQPEEDGDDTKEREKIANCVGVSYDTLYSDANAEAESPDFTNEDDETVSVRVVVDTDESTTIENFGIVASPKYRECVSKYMGEAVEESMNDQKDGKVGNLSLNEVSLGNHGDQTVAFRVTIPIEVQGFNLEATGDFALVRVGRALTNVSGMRFDVGSMTTDDFVKFVETATKRLQAALTANP